MKSALLAKSRPVLTNWRLKLALCLLLASTSLLPCSAEDITTLDGKKYSNVREVKKQTDGIVFSYGPETAPGRVKVAFRNLSAELKKKYSYDPFEEGFYSARMNRPIKLNLNSAYRLSNLELAKQKAKAENKLLGFIMVWDSFFQKPAHPMGLGGDSALAGFFSVFNQGMVLVFVRHEDELNKAPDAVKKGFFGPDEGGWAPNMAVVTEDCSQFVCEVPLGGENSNGAIREQVFRKKIAEINKFLEKRK
jgi:hypothetical protein